MSSSNNLCNSLDPDQDRLNVFRLVLANNVVLSPLYIMWVTGYNVYFSAQDKYTAFIGNIEYYLFIGGGREEGVGRG